MNKKTVIGCVIAIVAVVVLGIILYVTLGDPKVDTADYVSGYVCKLNEETNEADKVTLTEEDSEKVLAILNSKEKTNCYDASPYNVNISFVFDSIDGEEMFCLSTDGTSNIFIYNESSYITLSDTEWETINAIYKKYAG